METKRIDNIISMTKTEDGIVIEGEADDERTSITLLTNNVENLWFSIKRSQNVERLRTLRKDRIARMARGRIC